MDHIWSPWRMKYIRDPLAPEGCIFCEALKKTDGVENLIIKRGQHAFVILNRYPYTSGHVMVVPYLHVGTLAELPALGLWSETERVIRASAPMVAP